MRNFKKYIAVMIALLAFVHSTNSAFASEWLLHTGTKLEEARSNFDFCLGDYNNDGKLDIYAIKKGKTGTASTEVHILNGANNYQNFLLQTGTKLEEAGDIFDFCVGDYNGDNKLDLYALKKSVTGTASTEVHVLTIDGSKAKSTTNNNTLNQGKTNISSNTSSSVVNSNFVWPVGGNGGVDRKNYPRYSSGGYHSGTDISAPKGTPVYATYSGTVDTVRSLTNSYGKHVIIKCNVNNKIVYMYLKVIRFYFEHSIEKEDNQNAQQEKNSIKELKRYVNSILESDLEQLLSIKTKEKNTIMGILKTELLSKEEIDKIKLTLISNLIRYDNKKEVV